ncbi:RNA-binding protein [Opitutaceae bacterium TAV5]|nr:RNA-binding protein [Opitutaceae bacterium TAV5]
MKTKLLTRKVLSSHGHYVANAETGAVLLSYAPLPIKRFGFSQADISTKPIDILCVGYWLFDGKYEPPVVLPEKPLFIPLKREFFEAFKRGEKRNEYRIYGPCWNERTCRISRAVVLSLGYGKQHRLKGRITSFGVNTAPHNIPGWRECYGINAHHPAAVIGIALDK